MPYYFRCDGLLDTTLTGGLCYKDVSLYSTLGIRVWRVSGGVWYEITAGTPVAQVDISTAWNIGVGDTSYVGSWACPGSPLNVGDTLVVYIYGWNGSSWVSIGSWSTRSLNYTRLGSSTWYVTYWIGVDVYAGIMNFLYDSNSYPSNIDGIVLTTRQSTQLSLTVKPL